MVARINIPPNISEIAGQPMPVAARPAGYAALIAAFNLQVPAPDVLLAVSEKHTPRQEGRWRILTPQYRPDDTVRAHLDFALRHEGVDLGVLNALFAVIPRDTIEDWVKSEPTGKHARRIWFLYEWLTGTKLDLPDAPKAPYVGVLDERQQFAVRGETVARFHIRNNLPGTQAFCPLVRRTEHLAGISGEALAEEAREVVQRTVPALMARATALLLREDPTASYVIEGDHPPRDRTQRWEQALDEAGQQPLTVDQLLHLQRIVLGNVYFTQLGLRTQGGFIGKRDPDTKMPIPDHISARHEDLKGLMDGLIAYAGRAEKQGLDPIVAAAAVAFGFVHIHPFKNGNGRIHRWLVQHMLARRGFNPPGVVFPVAGFFLEQHERFWEVLQHHSRPRLFLTRWETTRSLGIRVLNQTRDLFRFFDATWETELLADGVVQTIRNTLPDEVEYEDICAFIKGVDHGRDSIPLKGIDDWLRARFKIRSDREWDWYISDIYDDLRDPGMTKTEFMYDLIEQFINETARKLPAS